MNYCKIPHNKEINSIHPEYSSAKKPEIEKLADFPIARNNSICDDIPLAYQNSRYFQRNIGNQAVGRLIQAKLKIGQPNDKYEQEADRVVEQVMRIPDPKIQCAPIWPFFDSSRGDQKTMQTKSISEQITPLMQKQLEEEEDDDTLQGKFMRGNLEVQRQMEEEEEEEPIQAKENSGQTPPVTPSLANQIQSLQSGGQPLPKATRDYFEPRFGVDLGQIQVHTHVKSEKIANALKARAFTIGKNIIFGTGQYNPQKESGRKLLAHELVHVIQQNGASASNSPAVLSIQRSCNIPTHCPSDFCRPFPSRAVAIRDRDGPPILDLPLVGNVDLTGLFSSKAEAILSGINLAVNSQVVPLWRQHIFGGSAIQDLSSRFANDFSDSQTTTETSDFLLSAMKVSLWHNPSTFPAGSDEVTINIRPRLNNALRAINTPGHAHEMNFNIPEETAGNLAGGLGRDQLSCRRGARPSPFNDSRSASGTITIRRNPGGTLTLIPHIEYVIRETIDLCPGDCGTSNEQKATVPISRWEASGISGDIPFMVRFPAPANPTTFRLSQLAVGRITASRLRLRGEPNTYSNILGLYRRGNEVEVLCQTIGETVRGNNNWYETYAGYISARYVRLVKRGAISACASATHP